MTLSKYKAPNGERTTPEARRMVADLQIEIADKPKPCCARIGHGSWCNLPDRHAGEHSGPAPEYGPVEAMPRVWNSTKGKICK
jgi:hypothetical protein